MAARGQFQVLSKNDGSDGAYRMTIEQRYTQAALAKKSLWKAYIPLVVLSSVVAMSLIVFPRDSSILLSTFSLIAINWLCASISQFKLKISSNSKALILNILIISGMISSCWNISRLSLETDRFLSGLVISSCLVSMHVFYHGYVLSQAWNGSSNRTTTRKK